MGIFGELLERRVSYILLIPILALCLLITSCGVVEFDKGCVGIKTESELKRDLARAFIEEADQGQVRDGLTASDVRTQGYKFLQEGTQLVVDNPQCFTKDEVRVAKNILGQS